MVYRILEESQSDMVRPGDSLLWHPNSGGHHIFNLNLALIIVSTLLVGLRLYVRKAIVKAIGWDDLIATVAWALYVTLSALEMDTTHYGTGAQIEDVPRETLLQFFKRLSIMELIYLLASGAVRLSILAFLPRLSKNKFYTWSIYALSSIVVVISLTGFFFVLTECSQIPDVFNYDSTWRQCRDKREERSLMLAHAIISIFVDCMLVALPLWVVSSYVKMGVKAIQILLVFSLGIFAVATGIVRFAIITTTDFNVNTTYKMLACAAWTDAELHVGLWVGCFPALQPILRRVSFCLGLRSRLDSTVPSGKRSTVGSEDASKRRSVMSRWSKASGHTREDSDGANQSASGKPDDQGFEMVDLERGDGDAGQQALYREEADGGADVPGRAEEASPRAS
ncbi:hypothetical protein Cob_v012700 [Colletotrichum orbiculare MAFF 240422]|uniref:Rhodopsin domain-containing protein n=1 Tax=Colletotrichum orbiculare (strain 104-T / ATCC 96160 / CBS 514.97 / LARS 414 / MAFF 240422) TaxID=1213857 RepID=A0A484F8H5_COLOR|nr:hypothetical protein Cob_v012700 [Colletotrichum orbiculare MAFF 240422]